MVWSIDDWFKAGAGRDRRSSDDEYVEYQAKYVSFSQAVSSRTGSRSITRSQRRAESSSRRSGRADVERSDGGRIRELIANAERNGYGASTPEIVTLLARQGIKVTTVRVEAVKAELRQEARTAAGLSVKPEHHTTVPTLPGKNKGDDKSRQRPRSDVPKKESVKSPDKRSKRRPVAQVIRVVFDSPGSPGSPGSPRSGGPAGRPPSVESRPASLSAVRAPATSASPKASSSPAKKRRKPKRSSRSDSQSAKNARVRHDQQPRRRELPLLESAYCPSCGFRPTLNGVCRC